MNTGRPSRAHSSQIGSSSGSSMRRREPSGFRIDRPRLFEISPTPTAPAATSASSCLIAPAAHSGPTFLKLMPARMRTRSFIAADAATAVSTLFKPIARQIVGADHHPHVQAVERRPERREPVRRRDADSPDVRGNRSPDTWRSAPDGPARSTSTSADSRECSAGCRPAPCSCADESPSCLAGRTRPPESACRVRRRGRRLVLRRPAAVERRASTRTRPSPKGDRPHEREVVVARRSGPPVHRSTGPPA